VRHALQAGNITVIEVETFSEVTRLANYAPRNTIAAQFSIPFALAVALLHDRIGPAEVSDANLQDPAVLDLARKVRVCVDEELDRQFPAKTMARVTIRTPASDYRASVEYPRGNPENPLSDQELDAKFVLLTREVISDERSVALRAAIRALPQATDIRAFTELLRY